MNQNDVSKIIWGVYAVFGLPFLAYFMISTYMWLFASYSPDIDRMLASFLFGSIGTAAAVCTEGMNRTRL